MDSLHWDTSELAETWLKPLNIPLKWKACKKDALPPEGLKAFMDSKYEGYASHWLWQAQMIWDKLHQDESESKLFHDYHPSDRETLQSTWSRLHSLSVKYANAFSNRWTEAAKTHAIAIGNASRAFEKQKRRSATKATNDIINKRRTREEPPAFKSLLRQEVLEAKILVRGLSLADCNVGRREEALRAVIQWLDGCYRGSTPEKRVFWLHGERSCGKSVIAHYIARACHKQRGLASGYVCQDKFGQRDWPGYIATFTGEFVEFFGSDFRHLLSQRMENMSTSMDKLSTLPPQYIFEQLYLPTFREIPVHIRRPMIMMLDELDRCEQWSVSHLCQLICLSIQSEMPVYWIVTSCDTPLVRNQLVERGDMAKHIVEFELPLYDLGQGVLDDPETPTPDRLAFKVPKPPVGSPSNSSENGREEVPLMSEYGALHGGDDQLSDLQSAVMSPLGSVAESDDEYDD